MQFSIYRVWLLCKKQWAENRQLYILGLLATAGIVAAAFLISAIQREGLSSLMQENILLGGAGIAGAIFTSTILSKFNDKLKGIQALTLPASASEKLATAIIYVVFFFPMAYLLVAYPVMALIHYIDIEFIGHISLLYKFNQYGHFMETLMVYLVLQALVLLCSVLFRRYTILKTIVLVILLWFGLITINPIIAQHMLDVKTISHTKINMRQILYSDAGSRIQDTTGMVIVGNPEIQSSPAYGDVELYFKDYSYKIHPPQPGPLTASMGLSVSDSSKLIFRLLGLLIIPFLWLITWFRLKETQL